MFVLRCVKTEPEHIAHYYAYEGIEVREDAEPKIVVGFGRADPLTHYVSEHRGHSQLICILNSAGAEVDVIRARRVKATRPEEMTRERV